VTVFIYTVYDNGINVTLLAQGQRGRSWWCADWREAMAFAPLPSVRMVIRRSNGVFLPR
jgi:hypothetical protein